MKDFQLNSILLILTVLISFCAPTSAEEDEGKKFKEQLLNQPFFSKDKIECFLFRIVHFFSFLALFRYSPGVMPNFC